MAEPSSAAALATAGLLADAVKAGHKVSEDTAEALAPEQQEAPAIQPRAEAEEQPEAPAEAPQEEPEEEVFELPEFKPVPEEEIEELEDEDLAAVEEPEAEEDDQELYYQPDDDIRADLARTKKQLDHERRLRVQANERKWREEASRRYPLALVHEISATSRRGFMRAAAKSHNAIYTVMKPHLDGLAEARKNLRAELEVEVRAEAEAAWGKAHGALGGAVPVQAAALQEELDAARQSGDLAKVFGVKRKIAEAQKGSV